MTTILKCTQSFRALHTDGLEEEDIRQQEYLHQVTRFDRNGSILSEETLLPDGQMEHKASYLYNEQGKLVEETLMEEDGFVSEHKTMEYDEAGRLCRERLHYMDETYDETTFTYDAQGRLTGKVTRDSDGEDASHTVFEYDGENLVAEIEYGPDNEVVSEKRFEFEEGRLLVSESYANPEGSYELVHEYDGKGQRALTKRYDGEGHLIERATFIRDEQGRVTETKEESTTGLEIMKVTLDDRGNVLEQATFNDKDELLSRITRTYTEQNQVETTHVLVEGRGQRPSQDYRLRFEYEYYTE